MYIVSFSPHNDPMKSVAYHPIIGSSSIRKVNFRKLTCLWSQGSWNSNSSHLNSNLCSFLINYFNWRLITLQYCSGFCLTLTWISHGCTCVPHPEHPLPPSPSHLSGSSQCTSPEHPVSCIELGLVKNLYFGPEYSSMWIFKIWYYLTSLLVFWDDIRRSLAFSYRKA